MTCILCNSIFLRPAEAVWVSEGDSQWARRFICGGCGAIVVVRVTKIGQGETDMERLRARHDPPPRVMLENGGTHK